MFDFTAFPTLETNRLILRQIVSRDATAIFRIRGDYEVTKYNSGAAYRTIEQAEKLIMAIQKAYTDKSQVRWGISLKSHGNVIGMCGYNYWNREDHRGSIGYDLLREYWGQGIMPEALSAILDFGYTQMGLNRIEADASVYNTASIRVLQKLGFVQEGLQREQYYEGDQFHDLVLFSLIKREYQQETS